MSVQNRMVASAALRVLGGLISPLFGFSPCLGIGLAVGAVGTAFIFWLDPFGAKQVADPAREPGGEV